MPTETSSPSDRIPVKLQAYPGAPSLVRAIGRFLGHEYTFELTRSLYPDDCAIRAWVRDEIRRYPDEYNGSLEEDDDQDDPCYDCGWSIYSCTCGDRWEDD